jgi:phenylacetate-coenzyme A ligase PaaK-like adenylate-forming protein
MEQEFSEKIRSILAWVWRHPTALFYRAKYVRAAYDPLRMFRNLNDLSRVPFLTKSELAAARWQDILFLPFHDGTYITFTSGTTRSQALALFRAREPEEKCWGWLKGDRPPRVERLLILMLPHTILKYHPLAQHNSIIPVMGDVTNLANSARLAAHFETDGLHTLPALAIKAAPHFASEYDLARFRIISMVGEKVTPTKKAFLRQTYPRAAIYSYYSSAETGTMGYQCADIAASPHGNIYHFDKNKFFPEIIEPAAKRPLSRTEIGELAVTHLRQAPTPLIRFLTGDAAAFLTEPCGCGDANPLIRVEGRVGFDMVRAGGFEFRLESFEEAVRALNRFLNAQFRVEIREVARNGSLAPHITWRLVPQNYPSSPYPFFFLL